MVKPRLSHQGAFRYGVAVAHEKQLFHPVLLGVLYCDASLPQFPCKKKQAYDHACKIYSSSASSQHTVAPRAPPAAYTGAGIFRHARFQPEVRLR